MTSRPYIQEIYGDLPGASLMPVFDELFVEEKSSYEMRKKAQQMRFVEKYDAPPEAMEWVEKIAHEMASLAIQSRIAPVLDSDFHGLLKEADLADEAHPKILESIAEKILIKRAFDLRMDPIEEIIEHSPPLRQWMASALDTFEKRASTANRLAQFMDGVRRSVSGVAQKGKEIAESPSLFGSVGKWTALGVPVAGTAGYIKGRGDGKESGQQEMADALALRLDQLRQQYGEEA